MKYWPLIGLLLLNACEKNPGQVGVADTLLGGNTAVSHVYTHVYLLMGQSNMSGQYPSDPLSSFIGNPGNGAGPFIHQYMGDVDALYVQCAVGGTPISRWVPREDLYQACLAKIPNLPIAGMFFFQGENEAVNGPLAVAQAWGQEFQSIIAGLRQYTANPNLPIVFAQLGAAQSEFQNIIKDEQACIHIPHVQMIKTDDQEIFDSVHFTQDGYNTIGQRMANAMKTIS